MSQVLVTEQEKKLLHLVAKGERSARGDPYASVNGLVNGYPPLVTYTIREVYRYQDQWRSRRSSSSAVGRYQFIKSTLQEEVNSSGISLNTVFNSTTQDFLILNRLKRIRQMNQWLSGSITDAQFLNNLAKEFASIPVAISEFRPASRHWPARQIQPGESYYAGVGNNRVVGHSNLSVMLQELADIRNGGPGQRFTGEIREGNPTSGVGTLAQTERAAAGGQGLHGVVDTRQPNRSLPGVLDPYTYRPIHPLDNRYDFRTGEKVRDLVFNGVNPVSATSYLANNGLAVPNDTGMQQLTPEELNAAIENRSIVGYTDGKVDPGFVEQLRRNSVSPNEPPALDESPFRA